MVEVILFTMKIFWLKPSGFLVNVDLETPQYKALSQVELENYVNFVLRTFELWILNITF